MEFSKETLLAAADLVGGMTHADLTRLFQKLGYRDPEGTTGSRTARVSRFLEGPLSEFPQPDDVERGAALVVAVAESFRFLKRYEVRPDVSWSADEAARDGVYDRATRDFLVGLEADGYALTEEGTLAPAIPSLADPEPPLEHVERLLRKFGFDEAEGHRREALNAYKTGNPAAANGQARTFLLALVRALYVKLVGREASDDKAARDGLACVSPPFLRPDIKEWDPQGRATFLHGVFARLGEDGAHPGLSSPEEAKFRLRLVDVIALDWLERLEARVG
jgi:hypothetical protein